MLSKMERLYIEYPEKFEKQYGTPYVKKIRSIIRRKALQAAVDFHLMAKFDRHFAMNEKGDWLQNIEVTKRKGLCEGFSLAAIADLINFSGEAGLAPDRALKSSGQRIACQLWLNKDKKFKIRMCPETAEYFDSRLEEVAEDNKKLREETEKVTK